VPSGGAFWPLTDTATVNISQGTKHDFTVTPYIVIKNFHSTLAGTTLTLTFDIDAPIAAGLPTVKEVQPYVNYYKPRRLGCFHTRIFRPVDKAYQQKLY
jgi:hypothetical protein